PGVVPENSPEGAAQLSPDPALSLPKGRKSWVACESERIPVGVCVEAAGRIKRWGESGTDKPRSGARIQPRGVRPGKRRPKCRPERATEKLRDRLYTDSIGTTESTPVFLSTNLRRRIPSCRFPIPQRRKLLHRNPRTKKPLI